MLWRLSDHRLVHVTNYHFTTWKKYILGIYRISRVRLFRVISSKLGGQVRSSTSLITGRAACGQGWPDERGRPFLVEDQPAVGLRLSGIWQAHPRAEPSLLLGFIQETDIGECLHFCRPFQRILDQLRSWYTATSLINGTFAAKLQVKGGGISRVFSSSCTIWPTKMTWYSCCLQASISTPYARRLEASHGWHIEGCLPSKH